AGSRPGQVGSGAGRAACIESTEQHTTPGGAAMAVRVGINGFGGIGRNFLRAARKAKADIEIVAVNDLVPPATNAHLLKYDSTHGVLADEVSPDGDTMRVDKTVIKVFAERDPKSLPWGDLGIDVV